MSSKLVPVKTRAQENAFLGELDDELKENIVKLCGSA